MPVRPLQDRQRIKADGPTIVDLMHKHTLESTDKEGVTLREEYDYVPAEVLGTAGYHDEPDWCAAPFPNICDPNEYSQRIFLVPTYQADSVSEDRCTTLSCADNGVRIPAASQPFAWPCTVFPIVRVIMLASSWLTTALHSRQVPAGADAVHGVLPGPAGAQLDVAVV